MKHPNFLILPTGGSKGCVHPDVLYFPDGKDGYKFWMIYTPYPNNTQEQPYVVRSNDGVNWTEDGFINPVIQTGIYDWNHDHQADPAWCFIPEYDTFFLLWTVCPNDATANIAIAYSTDAQNWHFDAFGDGRDPILVENAGTPTIVYKNGIFQVWYNSGGPQQYLEAVYYLTFQWDNTNNRVINQSSSQGPWFPTSNETGSFYNGAQGITHVSVVCSGDNYYLYGSCYPAGADVNFTLFQSKILHCWKGTPPLNFTDYGTLLSPSFGWDSMVIYKSVLLTDCYGHLVNPNNQFWLYYSAYANSLQGGYEPGIPHIGLATAQYHDVEVVNVSSSKTLVGQMCNCLVHVTVFNKGDFPETFPINIYANTTVVGTQTVNNISNGTSQLLSFTWNTTGFSYGNYTLNAFAVPVSGETNMANNNVTGCAVTVTIPGDIDGDFKVSLTDLVLLAKAYGSKPSDAKWNPNADINGNGVVDLADLVLLANHYGQHYP